MAKKDEQEALYAAIADNFERMDKIIDEQIQPRIGWSLRFFQVVMMREKLETVLDVETEIAEVGLWLANYQRVGQDGVPRSDLSEGGTGPGRAQAAQGDARPEINSDRRWPPWRGVDRTMGADRGTC